MIKRKTKSISSVEDKELEEKQKITYYIKIPCCLKEMQAIYNRRKRLPKYEDSQSKKIII